MNPYEQLPHPPGAEPDVVADYTLVAKMLNDGGMPEVAQYAVNFFRKPEEEEFLMRKLYICLKAGKYGIPMPSFVAALTPLLWMHAETLQPEQYSRLRDIATKCSTLLCSELMTVSMNVCAAMAHNLRCELNNINGVPLHHIGQPPGPSEPDETPVASSIVVPPNTKLH